MSKKVVTSQINEVNRISSGTQYWGEMISNTDIRIDGYFEGKIVTEGKLVVGETAKVIGVAIADTCEMWGEFKGELMVNNYFGLHQSGLFNGNVACQKIFIDEGGNYSGSCRIISEGEFEKRIKEESIPKNKGSQ
ncbi:MAG: polymer-forming cytoskeletal protein [Bacteroidales bacterium]